MTTTLNGQILGQAQRATAAVLARLLDREQLAFESWVLLNQLGQSGGDLDEADLVRRASAGLKIAPPDLAAPLDALAANIARDGATLHLTEAGTALWTKITTEIAGITDRLYGDLPTADLVTAARVLGIVTARANAELAA